MLELTVEDLISGNIRSLSTKNLIYCSLLNFDHPCRGRKQLFNKRMSQSEIVENLQWVRTSERRI
ncbi:hypothetical protein Lbru_1594 [Legionella brunensis]|uniref:Uncharacterized protein n=1 Tax=Legionella brunensis TaxID=29422 RepID=A0A0W0SLM3_9GAMM|nr:hypothetical protein Lbru_1594 [Legionella brunensis]